MMSLWHDADHQIGWSLRGAQVLYRRQQRGAGLAGDDLARDGFGRGPKHGVRDPRGAGDDHTETEAGA